MPARVEVRWRLLRHSLAACIAGSLAGGAAAGAAWWHESGIEERVSASESRVAEARGRYAALAEARRERQRIEPRYRRWVDHGRIGVERPVQWTESLRGAANDLLANGPRPGSPHVIGREGPVEVRAVDMSFDLEMRHEGELPEFLAELEDDAPGLFTLSGCRLSRMDDGSDAAPPPTTIRASCRLRWLTVLLSGVEPGWLPEPGPGTGEDDSGPGDPTPVRARRDSPRDGFGRLFTTVAERAEIDSALAGRDAAPDAAEVPGLVPVGSDPPPPPPPPARWIRVGGVVARAGRPIVAWVDGERIGQPDPRPGHLHATSARSPHVRLDAGGGAITVRPGQRFNPLTGAVIDPVRRTTRRLERARFLRDSSRPPLTPSRAPGQN